MPKLKVGDCALTRKGQPYCNIRGKIRFVKKASKRGREALRGLGQAVAGLSGRGKGKGKGTRAGVPSGYSLMRSHRKGAPVPKGSCFRSKGRLWCRMKNTGRVKQMKTT